ncbi:MAG: isocitrate/isopropylmalate dehydrogenase family protein [Chloroflexi bacterium]|nr:isocitrate/isopropylmalate dehydrogenase family protein [Chloroflexota bacterium]
MTTHTIVLIPGDGIGQEVIPAARLALEALDLPLVFREADAGFAVFERTGSALPAETLAACADADAVLFGATQSPMTKVSGYASPILALRRHFDLYANLRPAVTSSPRPGGAPPIDLLVVRENTEGLYSGRERVEADGEIAITERVITAHASRRITEAACQWALRRRGKLTLVHKANVLKETCGLFRRAALEVTAEYPTLEVEEMLVDTTAMRLVQEPERFDVIVTTNLFGDILSDLAAGLTGGLGLAASANVGEGRFGLFEPVHGSAPDIAGQDKADPRAAILSAALMLAHLGYNDASTRLQSAAYATAHTGSTRATSAAIAEAVRQIAIRRE